MNAPPRLFAPPGTSARIARLFPSFRDFVDDALFHPTWGYYSTGAVRFGEGGHYDTFPIALSPYFGRMLAQYAYRSWRRAGEPADFEICELGAGNGQLCLDALAALADPSRTARTAAAWRRFAAACRYRIIERSPALIARQRQQLGPLAVSVTWTRADLSQRAARGAPFGRCGVVIANEVLDCLACHKIVPRADGSAGVVYVLPTLPRRSPRVRTVSDVVAKTPAVPHAGLATIFTEDRLRRQVRFQEVVLPLATVPGLRAFVRRHYPELLRRGTPFPPYFACPAIEPLVGNVASLYRTSETLWIDYGEKRQFHLAAPEVRKVFAGPPQSGASVYRAPGLDDITFMVDFSIVAASAERAGLGVEYYGGQGALARRSGVTLDRRAVKVIVQHRLLGWMLALIGVGPEREWRHTALTWSKRAGGGGPVRTDVRRGVDEFLGKRHSHFKLMILRSASGAG